MGTDTTYRDELAERAASLSESSDERKQEQGAELEHLVSVMSKAQEEALKSTSASGQAVGVLASDVEQLSLEWVWPGWIPRQFFGIFVGDSGLGKSSVIRDLTRRLTRGEQFPDGQVNWEKCGVVYISYEEPTQTVLAPRLAQCGADMDRVKILSTVELAGQIGQPAKRPFRMPEDLGLLREAIYQVDAGVVFIDPLGSMSDQLLSRSQTVRPIILGMQQVAEDTGCAIVVVAHLNKGRSTDMRQRMQFSKSFYDTPRFIIATAQDISNPRRATLWMEKHSLCGEMSTLTYEREGGMIRYISGHAEEAKADAARTEAQRTSEAILQYMGEHPERDYQAPSIARVTRLNYDAVRKQMQRLTNEAKVVRTERGWYRLPQPGGLENTQESVPCPNSVPLTQIASVPVSHEEYIKATNAPTVKLDVTKLSSEMQQVVANVTNGKGEGV